MIDIVHYSPEYEKAHYEFATGYWKKRKRVTAEYLYWKFRGKQKEKLDAFLLALDNKKVIGQLGLIPCSIVIGEELVESQWACDLMVDTTYRGKGIAKLLYDYAFTLKPVTLGSDPSPAASISMKRAGFITLQGPYKFFFPTFLGEVTKLKGFNLKLLDKIPNPFLLILKLWNLFRTENKFRKINLEEYEIHVSNLPQTRNTISVLHDKNFIDWRLKSYKDYYKGIDIFTYEKKSNFLINRSKETYLVIDYFAVRISLLLDLLSQIVTDAKKNKIRTIKLMANSNKEFYILFLFGFLPFRTRTEIIFYCADEELKQKMLNKYFRYTYMDSDENI